MISKERAKELLVGEYYTNRGIGGPVTELFKLAYEQFKLVLEDKVTYNGLPVVANIHTFRTIKSDCVEVCAAGAALLYATGNIRTESFFNDGLFLIDIFRFINYWSNFEEAGFKVPDQKDIKYPLQALGTLKYLREFVELNQEDCFD